MTTSTTKSPYTDHFSSAPTVPNYVGRFAPSPTGPLHFGSLIAALASYFDARSKHGHWLVRIEDLDPPREIAGAASMILDQLNALGLIWDGQVLYQSSRLESYETALQQLDSQGLCFYCNCTRARMHSIGAVYDGHCRARIKYPEGGSPYAIRLQTDEQTIEFEDRIQGSYLQNLSTDVGDFVIRRKDKLFAYQLAVVVDDDYQQVTDVVRGYDLIDSTPRQMYLQQQLGLKPLRYAHFPVAADHVGEKLSKQHHAQEIEVKQGSMILIKAMEFLGLRPPHELTLEPPEVTLAWGISHWDIQNVPKLATINGIWT
ncbi:MAG: tRNA glutamyl-Q(34) synthetase GluQRS [Pseudohongiellaceae bacterium]